MASGRVRGILWKHLHARAGPLPATDGLDPTALDANALLPSEAFAQTLRAVAERDGAASLVRIGRDYATLWSRTFPTLVRHTAGRPRDMLGLVANEVMPYLRGHPLAARAESPTTGQLALRLEDDLPAPYLQGLLEGFFALAQCDAAARHDGGGLWSVRVQVDATARLQHMAHLATTLRIPYLVTALAGTLVGLAAAPDPTWLRALAVLVGIFSAQAAANAMPDLLGPTSPLQPRKPRLWLALQLGGSATVAALCAAWLALAAPIVLAFAATGALAAVVYPFLRRMGLGPVVTALAHGPILTAAVAISVDPLSDPLTAARAGIPVGLAAAALLVVGDMADRPLDEAAGDRTLAVRLPGRSQMLAFAVPLGAALAAAAIVLWPDRILGILSLAALSTAAGFLVVHVARHAADPSGLAPARLATLILHVGITGTIIGGFL